MSPETHWYQFHTPGFELGDIMSLQIANIERQLPGVIPDVRQGRKLYVGSDYGGSHQTAKYETYSFVIADDTSMPRWNYLRQEVRNTYLARPGDARPREMSYKDLRDGYKQKALLPFLEAANALQGLSLTVAVDRSIRFLAPERIADVYGPLKSPWNGKEEVFDKLQRIVHFISLLLAGLSFPGQEVDWVTDRDDIACTPERRLDLQKMLYLISDKMYLTHPLGALAVGTNEHDPGMLLSDYLAIPDLVAGCFSDVLYCHKEKVRNASTTVVTPFSMKGLPPKSKTILNWHIQDHHPLKRLFCVIDPTADPEVYNVSWPLFVRGRGFVRSPYVLTL